MENFKTILLYLFLGFSILVFPQTKKNDSVDLDSNIVNNVGTGFTGYPVNPFKDTLFFVYDKIGSVTAQNRANAIKSKIELLYKDPFYQKDSLILNKSDFGVDIVYKSDLVVMSVTDSDGKMMGSSNFELAQKNLAAIQKAILFQKENNSEKNWLKKLGIIILMLACVGIITIVIKKRFRWF